MKFDLHVHSNYSDGLYSPKEIVDFAIQRKLSGIALTDHDSVEGIEEAIEYAKINHENFIVIPGIEFSSLYENEEVHILGYFVDYKNQEILEATNKLREFRVKRGIAIVKKINELGMELSINEVRSFSKEDYIGRPHIARAMIKNNYVSNIQEAFTRYLNVGKPAYVERYHLTIEETIKLIKKVGGISVIAHPGLLKDRKVINYCIDMGVEGIEVIHSKHTKSNVHEFIKLAREKALIMTGGSDCHGELVNGDLLMGKYSVFMENIPEMKVRI